MDENTYLKETIIRATTELIQENNGAVNEITSRKIAARAGVGLGLINYYFVSKDRLLRICVQRIINGVVTCFQPNERVYSTEPELADQKRLADWAKCVFDFLFEHVAISKLSILDDMQNYQANCNSVNTQRGFRHAIQNDVDEGRKRLLVFMLTSAMQVAFLQGESAKEIIGYNMKEKSERDQYIELITDILFRGAFSERKE